MHRLLVPLLLVLAASPLPAQGPVVAPSDYEALLIPLVGYSEAPGGGRWLTSLTLFADEAVAVYPRHVNCVIEFCLPVDLPVGRPYDPSGDLVPLGSPALPSLVYTRRGDAGRLHFSLRIDHSSRGVTSWGTAIPIVRERDLRSERLTIADVPLDRAFRVALRVYDPDRREHPEYVLRLVDDSGNALLSERRAFDAQAEGNVTPALLPLRPAWAIVDVSAEARPLRTGGRPIVVQIEPAEPGQRLWAFVSVTSNETRQVTVLTPN